MVNLGPILPVVHIRIVCEQLSKRYPCDFCHRSFSSELSLKNHINAEHQSLNVQDVYVCSVCKCCLLTQRDLLDHVNVRHKMQLEGSPQEESTICEICGRQLLSNSLLEEHLEIYHTLQPLHDDRCSFNIVELTLTDVWNMGMGDPECKTLFKILEIPVKEDTLLQNMESAFSCDVTDSAVKFISPAIITENSEYGVKKFWSVSDENTKPVTDDTESSSSILKTSDVESNCCIYDRDKTSIIHIQNIMSKAKTLKYKSENISAEAKGELILTVESDEKVIWSKDIVSKVLSSCSILGGTKSCIDDADVIVEKYEDCCNVDQPSLEEQADNDTLLQTQDSSILVHPQLLSVKVGIGNEEKPKSSCDHDHSPTQLIEKIEDEKESTEEIIIELSHDDESNTAILKLPGETANKTAIHEVPVQCSKNGQRKPSKDEDTDSIRHHWKRKSCRVCGMLFSNYQLLEKHESDAHGIRIKCEFCDDSFTYSKSLRIHNLRKHSSGSTFQCEICQKSFKSRGNLWTHRLTHTDYSSRRFECPKCPLRYHSKSKLNNHLQSHSGNKKYQCGECERGFLYPGVLLKHMEKHFTEVHKNLPENESLYLVEVEVEDTNTVSESAEGCDQSVIPSSSNSKSLLMMQPQAFSDSNE